MPKTLTPKLGYSIEQTHRNVTTVRMDAEGRDWEAWFLLRSDAHHDNAHCNHKLEKKHLDQAMERGAGIIDAGDLFCAMQGKWDKRADQNQLREELRGARYIDQLVSYNADFYEPYAENIVVLGFGNHETGILKHHETHLTERMAERLRSRTGAMVPVGGYGGWVRFNVTMRKTVRDSRLLHYFHGSGGGGEVTRGVISTNRQAVYNPDPHIILTGHTHDAFLVPIARSRLSEQGIPYQDEQVYIRTPGYKDEYLDRHSGWHVERGGPPKPLGAAWLRLFIEGGELRHEVTFAK